MNFGVLVLTVSCTVVMSSSGRNGSGACCEGDADARSLSSWTSAWSIYPGAEAWSLDSRIPMTSDYDDSNELEARGKYKYKKKLKKFLLPLLLAYKLKFFTLIPVLIGGLVLLTGATGLAGFFFALFAAVMGLKSHSSHH